MTVRHLTPAPRGFHGDTYLLTLVEALTRDARVFIETGSNIGSTLGDVVRRYPHLECFSCEPDATAFSVAHKHSVIRERVCVFEETSQAFMERFSRDYADRFDQPLLAWLDAHDYGFEWPLREEIAYLTKHFSRGAILIDDFQVPGKPMFGWDQYDGRTCSFDFIESAINPGVAYRMIYPSYTEHTSPWHPLRGWGLLQFAPSLAELPRWDIDLPEVCVEACRREGSQSQMPSAGPGTEMDHAEAIRQLRAQVQQNPESLTLWNDLGAHLALNGEIRAAIGALASALNLDPTHKEVANNMHQVAQAQLPEGSLPLPVAPGLSGRMVSRDPYDDLRSIINLPQPVIVDGGANRGNTVQRLRQAFPASSIHAFEPIRELAQLVRDRFPSDERLTVHGAALSDQEGPLSFKVRAQDVMSSMYEPSETKKRAQGDNVDAVRIEETFKVRLDGVMTEPIDLMKLDLQGHEIHALEGAGSLLAGVRAILTEVEFTALYEGQPVFGDVDIFMRSKGFRLFSLYDIWFHPEGQVMAGDAIYVNEKYYS